MDKMLRTLPLAFLLAIAACSPAENSPANPYTKSTHMVAMRDGVRLYTTVYSPRDSSTTTPILLKRTPYSIGSYRENEYPELLGPSSEFDESGYIFAFQDVRGKFKSEGEFEVIKPLRSDPDGTDESTDTYDTIEWLLSNVEGHNGRVGQWGISYDGWQTAMGMIGAHPALKASSPQASPSDMFIGDDWHHNGAFRLMYAFSWLARNARTGPSESRPQGFDYGTPWGYRFFLELGPIRRIDELYFKKRVPAWNEFMEHGAYDDYWQRQNLLNDLKGIEHPILNVAGWFDAEDFYGPMSIYYTLEEKNPSNQSTLVAGPWRHGGWRSMPGDSLGDIHFGSSTSNYFQENVQFPFFQHYLKDQGSWSGKEAVMFETGTNQWREFDRWPPEGTITKKLFIQEGGKLSFEAAASGGTDSFVSDPHHPVPFSAEIRTTQGHLWMIEDQRFASTRPDVLVYQTDPLEEDITIAGPILANLFVSTSGTDSDFIVKLIDVLPGDTPDPEPNPKGVRMGDFQMLLAGEVFRAKFRNSYSEPEPLVPGEVTPIRFDLRDRFHTFRRGHRIMVHIQSTWFPVIDRNPQTFVDIYHAGPEAFQKASQTVYRNAEFPTHIELQVLP